MKIECGHEVPEHPPGYTGAAGYAVVSKDTEIIKGLVVKEGGRICYACAYRLEIRAMKNTATFSAYLSMDGMHITTWTGDHLATVVRKNERKMGGFHPHKRTFVKVRDLEGNFWWGSGPGPGMYCTIHRYKR